MELREYWAVIRKRWYIIVLLTLVASIVSAYYSFYVIKPIYNASTTLLLNVTQGSNLDGGTLDGLMRSQLFEQAVLTDTKIPVDISMLDSMMTTSLQGELLSITVTGPNQSIDAQVANAISFTFVKEAQSLMRIPGAEIVTPAVAYPNAIPVSPNKKHNIEFAAAIALLFSLGLSFILEYLDMRLKTEDEVTRHLRIPVLASVEEYKIRL